MNPRERVAAMLKAEMYRPLRWFYISIAKPGQFLGGCFIKARGPTDAWWLMHTLNLFPRDSNANTQTLEIPEEKQELVEANKEKHYRLLNQQEVELDDHET